MSVISRRKARFQHGHFKPTVPSLTVRLLIQNQQSRSVYVIAHFDNSLWSNLCLESRREVKTEGKLMDALTGQFIFDQPNSLFFFEPHGAAMNNRMRQSPVSVMFGDNHIPFSRCFPFQHTGPGIVSDYERSKLLDRVLFDAINFN